MYSTLSELKSKYGIHLLSYRVSTVHLVSW